MPQASSQVHLIVAPNYGEHLRTLPPTEEAWVADTLANKLVIQDMWSQNAASITSFQVNLDTTPEDWAVSILDTIEEHHGEYAQSPPYSALRVVGIGLSQRLRMELESCGFNKFEDLPDGFIAHKSPLHP